MASRTRTRLVHTVSRDEADTRLDLLVGRWLAGELGEPLSKSSVRKLIVAGTIHVDGREVRRPGALVRAASRLDASLDLARVRAPVSTSDAAASEVTVLYEDDDLIAVAKPAGIVMHATADPRRPDLFTLVRASRALPYLGLHHRLDVETSGVVLFTKRERANAPLAGQFARGEVVKTYHAVTACRGAAPRRRWTVENRLAMSGTGRTARMREAREGVAAKTTFTVIERLRDALLVEARPATGRKHQVRAHLAGSRLPILGDARYGGPQRAGGCAAPRVMLHAASLGLRHPVTGAALTIACAYPADFVAVLECLRRSPFRT